MRRVLWTFAVGLIGLGLAVAWVMVSLYAPYRGFPAEGVYVDIPRGASQRAIARILASQGVVRDGWVFAGLCRWRHGRTFEAGEYFFDRPVTSFEVFDALANGRVFVRELVVPEGYSMFDIADLVAREGFTTREDFLNAARDATSVRDLAPDAPTLEGFLFPAKYEFPRHPSGATMTETMVKHFRQEWAALSAQQPNASGLSLAKVVTLASLVERETPKADERPVVAGVFANRLRRGLPLQCDPTVVYALEMAGRYDGTLVAGDLPFESLYNTYRHTGLPPGPIANPGEASLRAALDPAATDDLYFVADTEGGHFFSKTLVEHNRNVAQYRQRLAAERRAAQAVHSGPSGSNARTGAPVPAKAP